MVSPDRPLARPVGPEDGGGHPVIGGLFPEPADPVLGGGLHLPAATEPFTGPHVGPVEDQLGPEVVQARAGYRAVDEDQQWHVLAGCSEAPGHLVRHESPGRVTAEDVGTRGMS